MTNHKTTSQLLDEINLDSPILDTPLADTPQVDIPQADFIPTSDRRTPPPPKKVGFQLRYLNTDVDIKRVISILRRNKTGQFLFYGVAGSGKTLLGEYIAKKLKTGLMLVTASDILARYNGESEANIREIFEEAEEFKRVLLIDEIGYFLTDRRKVSHSWETSQINELLTRLELFNGVFIGTTNFELDGFVDHAFYRRFDLKIKFNYMKCSQAKSLFRETLKRQNVDVSLLRDPTSGNPDSLINCYKELNRISKVTPADFALAVRKSQFLYDRLTPEILLKIIKDEIKIKPDVEKRSIGFI